MDNKEIAQILEEIAELLEIKAENPFKIRAYSNGARIVDGMSDDITRLAQEGRLREIKGIGEGLAEKIGGIFPGGFDFYDLGRVVPGQEPSHDVEDVNQ